MKKLSSLSKSTGTGSADARGDSSGSSVGLKRKFPNLGKQFGDARGRAPRASECCKLDSAGTDWPIASDRVRRTQH